MWFPNRSDTNRPIQSQRQARSLKFWSLVEEELYYLSSENKGADQLRGNREADLRLCFRLCRLLVFPWGGSDYINSLTLDIVTLCHHFSMHIKCMDTKHVSLSSIFYNTICNGRKIT